MRTNEPLFLTLDRTEQRAIVEALIFAANSDDILSAKNIFDIIFENQSDLDFAIEDIEKIVDEINDDLDNSNRPYRIVNYAGGYQFVTLPQYGEMVYRMLKSKTKKNFSAAQLETLSIIAYKQPVTKQEIDRIRGVMSSSEVINVLIEKELVKIAGRKDVIGKPLLYATTDNFLKTFGLNQISDLPKLKEIEEIAEQKLKEEEEEATDLVLTVSQEDIEKLGNTNSFTMLEDSHSG